MIHRKHYLACVSAGALAAVLATPAIAAQVPAATEQSAQSAPATGTAPNANAAGDTEIVITAQKRSENVQRVPISVAAFSGETLLKSNVLTVTDLPKLATNFQTNKGVQSTYLRVAIRGIGAASNTAIEPSVAIFVDGVYVPRAGAIVSNLLDMERIEVLRGPQGTLFGRNASVGALSLITATPKSDLSARVTGEVGTGSREKIDGYVNVPLGQKAALRVAGLRQTFGGYWHNNLDGKRYGGHDDTQGRASLRVDAGPIEWIARADYSKTTGDGIANLDFDANSVKATDLALLKMRLGGKLPDTNTGDKIMNQFVTADLNDRQWGLSSTLSWSLGDSTLRLIDSYRDWKNDQLDGDVIFTPAKITSRTGVYSSKSQDHELQFISPKRQWLDGHFDLVAGLYYFGEKYELEEHLHMNAQYCNALVKKGPGQDACNKFLTSNGGHDAANQFVHQTVHSYAAYAQSDVHLNDEIFATVGGRYTKDKKHGDYLETVSNPFIVPFRAPEDVDLPDVNQGKFTYRLGLNYTPTKDLLFFGSYSTGYKAGGYNSGGGSPALTDVVVQTPTGPKVVSDPTRRVFGEETVGDWEVGAKTSWLNRALTANLTLYRMDISGYQDRSFDGTSFTVRNVGNLRQQGFEFDGVARPLHNLGLFASVAYLDSEFTNYPNAAGPPGCAKISGQVPDPCKTLPDQGQSQDLKGKPATFSPKWTGRIGVDYSGSVGYGGLTFDATSNLSFFSKQFVGIVTDANPQTIQHAYALLGARISLNGPNDRWTLSLFGDNLLNKYYSAGDLYQVLAGPLGLQNSLYPGSIAIRPIHGEPQTVGASFTVRY